MICTGFWSPRYLRELGEPASLGPMIRDTASIELQESLKVVAQTTFLNCSLQSTKHFVGLSLGDQMFTGREASNVNKQPQAASLQVLQLAAIMHLFRNIVSWFFLISSTNLL